MKITIESTEIITRHNGTRVRVWKGVTERGIPCGLFIAGIAVDTAHDTEQFDQELLATGVPDELRTLPQVLSSRMF